MLRLVPLALVFLVAGCAGSGGGPHASPEVAPEPLRYALSPAVHDTLAVFVAEARRDRPDRPLFFEWQVYGVVERGVAINEGPRGFCDSVLVARSNRYVEVNGERFPLVFDDDHLAVYDDTTRVLIPGRGPGLWPGVFTGCMAGAEFPMVVRFIVSGEITQTGRRGVVLPRYLNPRYPGDRR